MRTIVTIPDEQNRAMEAFCKSQGFSRAELIRRSLEYYLETYYVPDVATEAFGILKGKIEDGIAYQDKMRSEWE